MTFCVIIPTYNNAATLPQVLDRTLAVLPDVIVVNDGSTDATASILEDYQRNGRVSVIGYRRNRGKGYALRKGLAEARERQFTFAVTLDADGQHFPEDIPLLQAAVEQCSSESVLAVGSRNLTADGMPKSNTFANRFSNFWFRLQTGVRLPDTQTGFRAYPLKHLPPLWLLSHRYESELELLVFSAWRGVRLLPVPVRVCYPEDRVTHFRPFADFARISILNTILCFAAIFCRRKV